MTNGRAGLVGVLLAAVCLVPAAAESQPLD
jgi:hypothetical protein